MIIDFSKGSIEKSFCKANFFEILHYFYICTEVYLIVTCKLSEIYLENPVSHNVVKTSRRKNKSNNLNNSSNSGLSYESDDDVEENLNAIKSETTKLRDINL